ncbi:hypothetical protein FGRMN_919 [Fusarium graminum]|nr:hypothetical protein FGRMN_919 [Fusarium graminum]
MDDSNIHHMPRTEPSEGDLDTSGWAADLNIWDFVLQDDSECDHFSFDENLYEAENTDSNRLVEPPEAPGIDSQSSLLDVLDMPESFNIEQILEQDPDIYGACETNDLPLEAPIIEPRMQPFSPESLTLFLQPPPPSQEITSSPDEVPIVPTQWLDRQVAVDDFNDNINFEGRNSTMGDGAPMAQGTSCTILRDQKSPKCRQTDDSRCAPCRFANIPKMQDWEQSSFVLLLSPTEQIVPLPKVMYFELSSPRQPDGIVAPAMDAVQLDTFIDRRRSAQETKDLADIDVLIKKLCHRAAKSINRTDDSSDPVTICCALWIVFSATHKFEKRNFDAKSLKNLKKFLGSLRDRSKAAFQSLDHYKRLVGASCCGRPRNNDGAFSKLIEDAKKQKALVNFVAEHQTPDIFSMTLHNSVFDAGLRPQSYPEILESEILFHEDAALFFGCAKRRNLEAPLPSSRTQRPAYTRPDDDGVGCSAAGNASGSSSTTSGVRSRTLEEVSTPASQVTNLTSITSSKSFGPMLDQARRETPGTEERTLSNDDISFSIQKFKRTRMCQKPKPIG